MRELSVQDIGQVSGSFGPAGAVGGAITAGFAYYGSIAGSGQQGSWSDFALAVGTGAASGFLLGPGTIATTMASSSVAFYSGMAGGLIYRGLDASGTNYNEAGTNYNQ